MISGCGGICYPHSVSAPESQPSLLTRLPRGVVLRDPLMLSSGCWNLDDRRPGAVELTSLGAVVSKGLTREARSGNPGKRLLQLPTGWMNSNGLQNPGLEGFNAEVLPRLIESGAGFLVNIVGESVEEYAALISEVESAYAALGAPAEPGAGRGLLGFELNLSCPNVKLDNRFATDPGLLRETVGAARERTGRLISTKLSPNVTDLVPFAAAAQAGGSDTVTIANTFHGVFIETPSARSYFHRPSAGVSGPGTRPLVLYHIWRCHQALPELPILGSGGIVDLDSALQHLLAGASALQLGSGLFSNPALPRELQKGLTAFLSERGESELTAIVGTFKG